MKDIFGEIPAIDPKQCTCHSGGAKGADTVWETYMDYYGGKTKAYSYKTSYHKSPNKVEITQEDYEEGVHEVNRANHYLNRWGANKFMNLLARNWSQVKYSNQIIAIGHIVKPHEKGKKGYYNRGKYSAVDGGTGYAVMMGILNDKIVHVYDQEQEKWYEWHYTINDFAEIDPKDVYLTTTDFAGIGTRDINDKGRDAIDWVFKNTNSKIS